MTSSGSSTPRSRQQQPEMTHVSRNRDLSPIVNSLPGVSTGSGSADGQSVTNRDDGASSPAVGPAPAIQLSPTTNKELSVSNPGPEGIPNTEINEEAQAELEIRRGMATMNAAFDWTGPTDPDNPRNFSLVTRLYSTATITFLAMVVTVAGSMYAPAQEDVAAAFGVSPEVAVLPLSLYNLGLAFGPLVGAPLSETYGRKAVFLLTAPTFMLFTLGAGFSKSVASLVVCRFFAGMFGAPLINNAPATMLDFTPGLYRGTTLGVYYTIPSFGASLGPLMGGFIVQRSGGWRWTQWAAIIFALAFYVPMLFTPETYKKIILRRRAIRLGLYDSASQRTSPGRAFRYFATTLIQRPLHMLFTEPIVTLVSLYCGFLYGLLYTFVVAVPWIFRHYYGFNHDQESLSFLGLIIGTLSASIPLVIIDTRFYQPRLIRWQQQREPTPGNDGEEAVEPPPLPSENRLIGALIGSLLLPPSLFAVAWTAHSHVHWIVPIFFQGCVMLASLLLYASASLFMLDAYGPLYGASASGAVMMSRYVLSAAFPLFALRMYKALGVGWATTLLAFVTVAMAPIPWCFWLYGEKLRKRSRYETSR
ncbi:hypothetical protein K4F52_001441 [Lecanicillium sp. MT-2017a]|nr:hypothetical protein K4F52_001441 [Lecanicillium sp. MT-2017a]